MKTIKLWGTGDIVKNQTTLPVDGTTVYDHIEALEGDDIDNHISIRRSVRNLVDNDERLFNFMEAVFKDSLKESSSGVLEDSLRFGFRVTSDDIIYVEDNDTAKAFLRVRPGIAQVNGKIVISSPTTFIAERELEKIYNLDTWHPITEKAEVHYDFLTDRYHARILIKDSSGVLQTYEFTNGAPYLDFQSGGHESAISLFKQIQDHSTLGATFKNNVASLDSIALEPVFDLSLEEGLEFYLGFDDQGEFELSSSENYLPLYHVIVDTITEVNSTGDLTSDSSTIENIDTTDIEVGMAVSGSGIPADTEVDSVDSSANTITLSDNATSTDTNVALTFTGEGSSPSTLEDRRVYFQSLFKYVDDSVHVGEEEPGRYTTRDVKTTDEEQFFTNGDEEFKTSDYPLWINTEKNNRYNIKSRYDDGWKNASPLTPEDLGSVPMDYLGKTVPRFRDLRDASFRSVGNKRPSDLPSVSDIWIKDNLVVTVGPNGQFNTINSAIEFLSNYKTVYRAGGLKATIRLLEGFYMKEQVLVEDMDLGWIQIETVSGISPVSISEFVQGTEILGYDRPETTAIEFENYEGTATASRLNNQYAVITDNINNVQHTAELEFEDNRTASDVDGNRIDISTPDLEYYIWFNYNEGTTNPQPAGKEGIEINVYSTNTITFETSSFVDTDLNGSYLLFENMTDNNHYAFWFNVNDEATEPVIDDEDGNRTITYVEVSAASYSDADAAATDLANAINDVNGFVSSSSGNVVTFSNGSSESSAELPEYTGYGTLKAASLSSAHLVENFTIQINNSDIGGFEAEFDNLTATIRAEEFGERISAPTVVSGSANLTITETEIGTVSTEYYIWFNVNNGSEDPIEDISEVDGSDKGFEIEVSSDLLKASEVISLIKDAIDGSGIANLETELNGNQLVFFQDNSEVIRTFGDDLSINGSGSTSSLSIFNYDVGSEPLRNHFITLHEGSANQGFYFWINPDDQTSNPGILPGLTNVQIPLEKSDDLETSINKISTAISNRVEFQTEVNNRQLIVTNSVTGDVNQSSVEGSNISMFTVLSGRDKLYRVRAMIGTQNQFSGRRKELTVNLNGLNATPLIGEYVVLTGWLDEDVQDEDKRVAFWFAETSGDTLPEGIEDDSDDQVQILIENPSTVSSASDIAGILIAEILNEFPSSRAKRYDDMIYLRSKAFTEVIYTGSAEITIDIFDEGDRAIIRDHEADSGGDYNGFFNVFDVADLWIELDYELNNNAFFDTTRVGISNTAEVASPLPVPVSRESLTRLWQFFYYPAFGVIRGTLPTIACEFEMDETGDNPYMSYKDGLCATDQGRINVNPFCGFSNAGGTNLYGTRASIINANDGIFNRGKRYGIWAFANSIINARRAEVNNCGFGAYEINAVEEDEERATFGSIEPLPRVDDPALEREATTEGLEAYYEFDGDYTDSSGNGNDGTASGSPTIITDGLVSGINSVDFGADEYVNTGFIPENYDEFSISGWFKPKSSSGDRMFFGSQHSSSRRSYFGINSGYFGVGLGSETWGGNDNQLGYGLVEIEKFYHIVVVFRKTTTLLAEVYINKNLVKTISNSQTQFSEYDFYLAGNNVSGSSNVIDNGLEIANFRFYSRALSDQEVEDLYRIQGLQTVNLEAYYPFNEETEGTTATGSILDDTDNNNDGTVEGAPVYRLGPAGGGALEFDGENDYISYDLFNFITVEGTYSFSCWVKNYSSSIDERKTIFTNTSSTDDRNGLMMTSDKILFSSYDGSQYEKIVVETENNENKWINICAVQENGIKYLYINGKPITKYLDVQANLYSTPGSQFYLSIGSEGNQQTRFNGQIAEPRIYSRALSEAEIEWLYYNPMNVQAQTTEVAYEEALDFNTNDYPFFRDVPASNFNIRGFTLSTWVWRHRDYDLTDGRLFDKSEGPNGENGFFLSISDTGALDFRVNARERKGIVNAVPEEEWTLVTLTLDKRFIRYYINGELSATILNDNDIEDISTDSLLVIGNRFGGDRPFKGYMEEIRVYDFVLNDFQIEELYSTPVNDTRFYKVFDAGNQPIGNGVYASRGSMINASEAEITNSFGDNVFAEFGSTINIDSEQGAEDFLQQDTVVYNSYYGEDINARNASVYNNGGVQGLNILTTVKQIG